MVRQQQAFVREEFPVPPSTITTASLMLGPFGCRSQSAEFQTHLLKFLDGRIVECVRQEHAFITSTRTGTILTKSSRETKIAVARERVRVISFSLALTLTREDVSRRESQCEVRDCKICLTYL
jgi:hypothetical protein